MKSDTSNINKLCIPGELIKLAEIRGFVQSRAVQFGFDEDQVYKITLAVDEACSNLIRHSFKLSETNNICVEIQYETDKFIILISDNGTPFNPINHNPPNMNEYFKTFQRGGLGIHIIKSVMDDINYSVQSDKNTLKLTKYLKSA